jgi:hypothetical protein
MRIFGTRFFEHLDFRGANVALANSFDKAPAEMEREGITEPKRIISPLEDEDLHRKLKPFLKDFLVNKDDWSMVSTAALREKTTDRAEREREAINRRLSIQDFIARTGLAVSQLRAMSVTEIKAHLESLAS